MREHDDTTLFNNAHLLKDARLCLQEAETAGVPFAAAGHARDILTATMGRGHADQDHASIIEAVEGLLGAACSVHGRLTSAPMLARRPKNPKKPAICRGFGISAQVPYLLGAARRSHQVCERSSVPTFPSHLVRLVRFFSHASLSKNGPSPSAP